MRKLLVCLMLASVFTLAMIAIANACKTQGYWKNHPEAWPLSSITMGGVTYTKAQAIAILKTPPLGDATYILAHQLIAGKLNYAMGYMPDPYPFWIGLGDAFLSAHPLGTGDTLTTMERAYCIEIAEALDTLNNTP